MYSPFSRHFLKEKGESSVDSIILLFPFLLVVYLHVVCNVNLRPGYRIEICENLCSHITAKP